MSPAGEPSAKHCSRIREKSLAMAATQQLHPHTAEKSGPLFDLICWHMRSGAILIRTTIDTSAMPALFLTQLREP